MTIVWVIEVALFTFHLPICMVLRGKNSLTLYVQKSTKKSKWLGSGSTAEGASKKTSYKKMMKRKHLSRPRHHRVQTKIANKNWTFQFHAFWRQVVPWSSWWYPQECWRTLSGNLALEPYSPPNLPKEPSRNYPQNLSRTPYSWLRPHDILLWKPREWCVFCILYPFTFEMDQLYA